MSLTPDSTADNAMNSASHARAIKRASVVLPTPGGPHRIMECSLPARAATASGRPSPSRCVCPTTSCSRCGRMASASGACGRGAGNRSGAADSVLTAGPAQKRAAGSSGGALVPEHVRPCRRSEGEQICCELRIALEFGKADHGDLAHVIVQLHRVERAALEAHADFAEHVLRIARIGLQPVETAARAFCVQVVVLLDIVAARQ